MKNTIAERIVDFIKNYPPFLFLTPGELLEIASQAQVLYLEKNEVLFKLNDPTHSVFYMVKDGAVGLHVNSDTEELLIDKCDEGDVLGLRPFFAKNNYLMTAKAREESILYAIPIEVFKPYVAKNQDVLSFLLESFASNTRNPYDKEHKGKLISENFIYSKENTDMQYFQPITYTKNPITASPSDIVKHIAQTMTSSKIGSIIIQDHQKPIGIVTDKDLRSKIATGLFDINTPVSQIMSAPVITVSEHISIAETQLTMLRHGIGHLCVTTDGTPDSKICGIISEHDVVMAQANNPGVLLKETNRATRSVELKRVRSKLTDLTRSSLEKNVPIHHLSRIIAEINDAITRKSIELAIEKMGQKPPARFAWLSAGSQGRKEQLLLTDQDHAIVFESVEDERYITVKKYFLSLAKRVSKTLYKIGYSYSSSDMMASNSDWCKSVEEWKKQYRNWIKKPDDTGIALNTLFFDFSQVYGDTKLTEEIINTIAETSKDNQLFFAFLGTDALKNPPPLGFFRQFLVEKDGEHKDNFDVKSRALLPLIDAARLLTLSQGITGIQNTYSRFSKMAELEPQNKEIYEACAEAFLTLHFFRTKEGLENNNNGNYLSLRNLSKSDKVKLKNAFAPIHEIQDIIKGRFQLTYFT